MLLPYGLAILHAAAVHLQVGAAMHRAHAGTPLVAARPRLGPTSASDTTGPLVTRFHWPGDPRPIRVQWWLPQFLRRWFSVS
jgi:hypothetical protein